LLIAADADSTAHERATALDDFQEIQLWYEQDFFAHLRPNRQLPALPSDLIGAADRAKEACAWKYSAQWREFVRQTENEQ
jgi:hypothetical protein